MSRLKRLFLNIQFTLTFCLLRKPDKYKDDCIYLDFIHLFFSWASEVSKTTAVGSLFKAEKSQATTGFGRLILPNAALKHFAIPAYYCTVLPCLSQNHADQNCEASLA
ncbi:MAG: hypothetical protein IKE65_02435 [Clostridia bacterium]|nr:hypothetical protein [Clostridia bacterium]